MMRRNKLLTAMGAVLLACLWAGPALAAPADVTRAPDGELRFCREGFSCTARAIGDFNGDGADDIVFEVTEHAGLDQLMFGLMANIPVARSFELHLSPFKAVGSSAAVPPERAASKRVLLRLHTSQVVDVVTTGDLDGDGIDDLVLARMPEAMLIALRGRSSWSASYDLDRETVGDLRLDLGDLGAMDGGQTVLLTTGTADVNADGKTDLLIGRDFLFGEQRQSEAYVMLGGGKWADFKEFNPATRIMGLGGCVQGLAGTGDVTGDKVDDIVLRRCVAKGQPTQLRVLPGRATWPATLSAENVPDIVPPPEPEPPAPAPPSRGGYLPDVPQTPLAMPDLTLIQDINGDGIGDLGLEFAGKTHLFYGGSEILTRTRTNRTSGVFLRSGFGAMPLTRTWRMLDLNADGRRDLLLSQPIAPALLVCPSSACGGLAVVPASQPVYGFTGAQTQRRVIDPRMDAPDVLWNSAGEVIWGTGDFSGDGKPDLLLGSPPGAFDSVYTLVFGPLSGS
jgi:hypothetical protein